MSQHFNVMEQFYNQIRTQSNKLCSKVLSDAKQQKLCRSVQSNSELWINHVLNEIRLFKFILIEFILTILVHLNLQWGQLYGFAPVWIRVWRFKSVVFLPMKLHWGQWCFLSLLCTIKCLKFTKTNNMFSLQFKYCFHYDCGKIIHLAFNRQ